MPEKRIKKAKVTTEGKIALVFDQKAKEGGWDEYSMTCSELPRPEFHTAMQALAVHVVEMCELPEEYLERIKVRGVSFSYGGEAEVMGATISAEMLLNMSTVNLNLNTPHKASDFYSENGGDERQLLSGDCVDALLALQRECEEYIKGNRAQTNLFPFRPTGT